MILIAIRIIPTNLKTKILIAKQNGIFQLLSFAICNVFQEIYLDMRIAK